MHLRLCPTVPAHRLVLALVLTFLVPFQTMLLADDAVVNSLPANLDQGLRRLIGWHRGQPRGLSASERRTRLFKALPGQAPRVQTNADATGAVVDVMLDGTRPGRPVRDALTRLGAEILAEATPDRKGGTISAELPLDQAVTASQLPGVFSISLVHQPWRRVGKATSQGATVLQTAAVNQQGIDGTGITVGVISDSFDKGQDTSTYQYATHAADDVRNGDLPGPGNPFGHTTPVKVVADAAAGDYQTDEGRAMLQIVHDLAPGARLMFQAAGRTPETLAAAITNLRSQTNPACDVIVDDFGFPDEPFFSDGPAALAASVAATSRVLPGRPVVYVSAAGNEGDVGYSAEFAPISDAAARAGIGSGNLKLEQVPGYETAWGFHNFSPKPGKVNIAQKVKLNNASEIVLQWDDPFLPGQVETNYNLLVFDAEGNYLSTISGTSDAPTVGKAVQIADIPKGTTDMFTVQLAIAQTKRGTGLARRLRYVAHGGEPIIKYAGYNNPTTFGHNAGANVIGVAAYDYRHLAEPEAYSSVGPATIYFDAQGARLPTPTVRQQPAVAAVDGVDTSFFPPGPLTQANGTPGTDTDGDGLPNFYGTSAAAPHVAAVAALLLQAGGGKGSLTGAQVLSLLQGSAAAHDLDPNSAGATLPDRDGATTTLSATGDESNASLLDPNFFHLEFTGPADRSLVRVFIDLSASGLVFAPNPDNGLPFTVGNTVGLSGEDVGTYLDPTNTQLTLQFTPGVFTTGKAFNFGIGRGPVGSDVGGNSADLLAEAAVKAFTYGDAGRSKGKGALGNKLGTGYSPASGYGLVNAQAAVDAVRTHPPTPQQTDLVPGDILLTNNDNHLLEVQPDGTQVQTFAIPADPTGGTVDPGYEHVRRTIVDGNGNLVILYDAFKAYLFIVNPATGATTTLTAPGWEIDGSSSNAGLSDDIATAGRYVFATFGLHEGATSPTGTLLRFDTGTGAVQPFGGRRNGLYKPYTSLGVGPDGLLYALVNEFQGSAPVDVYDPNTLALVRSVSLNLADAGVPSGKSTGSFAVGPAGEFYALSNVYQDHTLYKLGPGGQTTATLNLPSNGVNTNYQASSLRANKQGAVIVGGLNPILVDPSFQEETVLEVFGDISYVYPPTVTADFVP